MLAQTRDMPDTETDTAESNFKEKNKNLNHFLITSGVAEEEKATCGQEEEWSRAVTPFWQLRHWSLLAL